MNAERNAKPTSTPKAGFFATLGALLPTTGRSASATRSNRAGRVPAVLCGVALAALLAGSAIPAAATETCPNDQLRSENNSTALPDCRAYEQVTPAFKSGSRTAAMAISPDGLRVVTASTGLFAGSQGGRLSAYYANVRTPSGWSTEALDPPSSIYPAQELIDVSADLGRSLWEARHPTESLAAENLVLREQNGTFVEVGPMLPPSATAGPPAGEAQQFTNFTVLNYQGASDDLSRVFFQINGIGPQWPGATTLGPRGGSRALYEYVGVGNHAPELVGVDGVGRLISDCGTTLGSKNSNGTTTDDGYNAISVDGETVFFTSAGHQNGNNCQAEEHAPEFNELYAKIGQGETAHTVTISEPSVADCGACQTGPADQAAAEFRGASRDGSKVFFLSEQELLPGDKGNNLYEYDFANPTSGPEHPDGKIVPVSTSTGAEEPGVQGVARVSEDGSHVYFVAHGVLTIEPNAEGNSPTEGADNLYLFERDAAHPEGRLAFVATLSPADNPDFGGGCFGGDWCARDVRPVQATADGRFLVFQSSAGLTPGDTSSAPQVFEYDAENEELVRVSVGEPGYAVGAAAADVAGASIPEQEYVLAMKPFTRSTSLAVSNDGAVVEFESAGGLTASTAAAGAAGRTSVFEYRSAGPLANGRVSAISNGSAEFRAAAIGTDALGTDAFFETGAPVLPSDRDTQRDLYDARGNGGFPAALVPHCEGEGCQGTPFPAPPESPPATPGFHGPGNEPAKHKCKQGFVKRHSRCVKKHVKKRHPKRSKRSASHNRGGGK